MDHSLKGYLERRSTEELDAILRNCLVQKEFWHYEEIARLILKILWEREKNIH